MGDLVKTREREISPLQQAFVDAFAESNDVLSASLAAGYADESGGRSALRSRVVQAALKVARKQILEQQATGEALQAMRELVRPNGAPPATRFAAAKWVLESSGYGAKDHEGEADKPIHEMSEGELHRFMERAEKIIQAGGDAPIIVVTPDDGALPALPA